MDSRSFIIFPITLVEGDNGELGVSLYNYLCNNYEPNIDCAPNETIHIVVNGSTGDSSSVGETFTVRWINTKNNYNNVYGADLTASGIAFYEVESRHPDGFALSETGECRHWSSEPTSPF